MYLFFLNCIPHPDTGLWQEGAGNHWNEVNDFHWLKKSKSPNWDIIPEGEREQPAVPKKD
jgi:hypothetical protein